MGARNNVATSGHGEATRGKMFTAPPVLLLQALLLPFAGFIPSSHQVVFWPGKVSTGIGPVSASASFVSNVLPAPVRMHIKGRTSSPWASIKPTVHDGSASGHGEAARGKMFTAPPVLLLQETIRPQHAKIVDLEDKGRRNNLVVFGVEEASKESELDLRRLILDDIFKETLGVTCSSVDRIHRIDDYSWTFLRYRIKLHRNKLLPLRIAEARDPYRHKGPYHGRSLQKDRHLANGLTRAAAVAVGVGGSRLNARLILLQITVPPTNGDSSTAEVQYVQLRRSRRLAGLPPAMASHNNHNEPPGYRIPWQPYIQPPPFAGPAAEDAD
ncbi:hypothetical protein HPB51_022237 [Rhipicephalus microplus]|uniref:Uncharacterized protein n=1 Tax=Rhipicephalus microplus TaxID=6941 RepID=A0A9J6DQN1_RHIMP|nr:hypothetical protein HPB51_022237 [Rhipicephalus microplus]